MTTQAFDPATAGGQATEILRREMDDVDAEWELIHEITMQCFAALGGSKKKVAARLRELDCTGAGPVDNGPDNEPEPDERDNPMVTYLTKVCGAASATVYASSALVSWETPDGKFECGDEDITLPRPVKAFMDAFRMGKFADLVGS